MFPFQISSSYFEPKILIQEMSSSSSTSIEFASTSSDSDSSMSTTTSSDFTSSLPEISCFFDPSTCEYQNFSIPEKILYYIAKNCTNAETFKKLVETCKYFFKVNPVIVIQQVKCYDHKWYAWYDWESRVGFKYDQPNSFKIWITECFNCVAGDASKVIRWIYKNDATDVYLRRQPSKFEDFLFLAANAKELSMYHQVVKYDNGEIVQLEGIVESLPKLKSLTFEPRFNGSDVNCNTARKLMKISNFKNISQLTLYNVSEALDVEGMFDLILQNKHIKVELWYHREISNAYKELVRKYSNLLEKENVWNSRIKFDAFETTDTSSSEDDSSDISFDSSKTDENEDLFFPWKNEEDEEWELPWDKED